MEQKKELLVSAGTEVKISTKGYYEFWYPSETHQTLGHDIVVQRVGRSDLKFHLSAKWVPYKVSRAVADLYGSPIQVLWINERGKVNV